jgi:hypothetical protein
MFSSTCEKIIEIDVVILEQNSAGETRVRESDAMSDEYCLLHETDVSLSNMRDRRVVYWHSRHKSKECEKRQTVRSNNSAPEGLWLA